ncbi:3-oxoacyl-[acyl-carrier-protein] synthase II, chloroplastic isoform X2 [Helianthus annuus]|uniref:3-oxoacyl-[acyl-carrier-protein] synthase II, chloroplastic isoform X2 n=1 Tax=Helianthus annuus TaxID=4232 RepID=UPI000B8F7B00|nr:3-oxoacyl-[acyl-carrier-protein] synthase II, chloroplastic isoform X2 [Helianthus annuus]XP_021994548.1 3-oxoacyl-[acyl-carrier-protein] synthase II, chloroplastic isoform X2 [Helianthus annuus]XP_021994549.1 3-oxoacyl-[acyl-carrier-protein] synthase II, chloroplastic isoform X2 [Helianthus annuus]XP_021994550.1 3-oxoacyl-[acyl-carrier-protein] synthase II, chloroplastic isoform X2 [Helianthus annuus]
MKIFQDAVEALRVSYKKMNPFCVPFAITNMGSAIIAMDLGWMGPNYSISTACATSNYCILNAANHIIRGHDAFWWFRFSHHSYKYQIKDNFQNNAFCAFDSLFSDSPIRHCQPLRPSTVVSHSASGNLLAFANT